MSIEETLRIVVREEVKAVIREFLSARTGAAPDEEWLKLEEACAVAKKGASTLRRARALGELKASGKGKSTRIRRSDLDAYLAAETHGDESVDQKAERLLRGAR